MDVRSLLVPLNAYLPRLQIGIFFCCSNINKLCHTMQVITKQCDYCRNLKKDFFKDLLLLVNFKEVFLRP